MHYSNDPITLPFNFILVCHSTRPVLSLTRGSRLSRVFNCNRTHCSLVGRWTNVQLLFIRFCAVIHASIPFNYSQTSNDQRTKATSPQLIIVVTNKVALTWLPRNTDFPTIRPQFVSCWDGRVNGDDDDFPRVINSVSVVSIRFVQIITFNTYPVLPFPTVVAIGIAQNHDRIYYRTQRRERISWLTYSRVVLLIDSI